ncbi:MAG: hypothetical protein D6687_10020 [Acidobacteria bacterium]|jgi:hypothetical protein|nr:MAG: hypothetical protein D6687_10020 [Acidobacteriota bacterium]GIU81202.1 MAG: hypothetical protein KatS3mg006_0266 [Pyrinomonadaceae bacterium]
MKKIFVTIALVLTSIIPAFSQAKQIPDFSGTWELDVQKSKLDARSRIEAMTIKVSQTQKELKVETNTKRKAIDNPGAPMGNRAGGGFGAMSDMNFTYSLDGKETSTQQETPFGAMPVILKAEFDEKESKLKLTQKRTINSPMGEVTITLKETWQLSQDGKTLIIKRELETPRGSNTSELVLLKKS